jgi:hypothetical protein
MKLFGRRARDPRLEDRLEAFRQGDVSAESTGPRVEAMLDDLGLAPQPREDVATGWTLDTASGRVTAVLARHDGELRLFHFFGYVDEAAATREGYAELLRINARLEGAHYCVVEIDGRQYRALRALVCPEGLELPALALALESLLRQARQTLPEDEPRPDPRFAFGDQLVAHGGALPPGSVDAALGEATVAVEGALGQLGLDWRVDEDQVHDWRISTDLGDVQIFLRPEGTSLVVRFLLEQLRPDDSVSFYQRFLEKSAEESAYCALTDAGTAERWMWVQAVVSARTIRPAVLAYAIQGVLRQARPWVEASSVR